MNMELLLEYQSVDLELSEFDAKLRDTETKKQMVRNKKAYKNAHDKLAELEQACNAKNDKIAELEKQCASLTADMEDVEKDISYFSECSDEELNEKDIRQMVKDAEKISDSLEKIKKALLQLKQENAENAKEMKSELAKFKASKEEFESLKEVYEKEIASGEPQLKEFDERLKQIEEKIDPELMKEYKRIKTLKKNPVAIFKDSKCTGCNMQLPSSVGAKIASSEKPYLCENCGRILALPQKKAE